MSRLHSTYLALVLLLASAGAFASPSESAIQAEIDALLQRLQTSGCQFNRSGSWYTSVEAQRHLRKKLQYLQERNLVKSAESFISLAASSSSVSGKHYMVRCGTSPAVQSKVWLEQQLAAFRSGKQ
jgi:hypothetical protein